MSEEAMLTFTERFDAIFDGPRFDVADALFAPDFIGHLPLMPRVGLEGWKHYLTNLYIGIPDLAQEINEVIVSEDRLVLQLTYSGTHGGPLFRTRATGNLVAFDGISIFRFDEQGRVAEIWAVLDLIGLLAQIGGFPSTEVS